MIRIVWTDPAVSDLDSIHAYIARDAEVYADAILTEIFDAVDRLADFPQSGRIVPELHNDSIREIITGNYRVIYKTEEDIVRILTIIHGACLFPKP